MSGNNRGKKILLVDDDQALRTVLAEQLDLYDGFTTIQVGTAAEGLEKAKLAHYDAVLLDIGLPDMDGLALLDLLKRTPETRHIPVHVISADDQKGLGLSMGAFGFTHKPVEREVVVSTLQGVKTLTTSDFGFL